MIFTDTLFWNEQTSQINYKMNEVPLFCPACQEELEREDKEELYCPECQKSFTAEDFKDDPFSFAWIKINEVLDLPDQSWKEKEEKIRLNLEAAQKALTDLLDEAKEQEKRIDCLESLVLVNQLLKGYYANTEQMDKALELDHSAIEQLKGLVKLESRPAIHVLLSNSYLEARAFSMLLDQIDLDTMETYALESFNQAKKALEIAAESFRALENQVMFRLDELISFYLDQKNDKEKAQEYLEQLFSFIEKRKEEDPDSLTPFVDDILMRKDTYNALEALKEKDQLHNPSLTEAQSQALLDSLERESLEEKQARIDKLLALSKKIHQEKVTRQNQEKGQESISDLKAEKKNPKDKDFVESLKWQLESQLDQVQQLIEEDQDEQAEKLLQKVMEKLSDNSFRTLSRKSEKEKMKTLYFKTKFEAANLYLELRKGKKARAIFAELVKEAWPGKQSDEVLYIGGSSSYILALDYAREEQPKKEQNALLKTLDYFERIFKQTKDKDLERKLEGELVYIYYRLFLLGVQDGGNFKF